MPFFSSNDFNLYIVDLNHHQERRGFNFNLKEERVESIVHNLLCSFSFICEEEEFITPCAQVNLSFDSSNHEGSLEYDLANGILNVFIDYSSDDFASSLLIFPSHRYFMIHHYSLETYQEVKEPHHVLMVMSGSHDLGNISKQSQIKIPLQDNLHDSIEHGENISLFQCKILYLVIFHSMI